MPRSYMCPCNECKDWAVDRSTYRRHASELAAGTRQRFVRWENEELKDETQKDVVSLKKKDSVDSVVDSDIEHSEENEDVRKARIDASLMAMEIVEEVSRGRLTITGADSVLRIFRQRMEAAYGTEAGKQYPSSWYKCRKLAVDGREPIYSRVYFCGKCDTRFHKSAGKNTSCSKVCFIVPHLMIFVLNKLLQYKQVGCSGKKNANKESGAEASLAIYFSLDDKIRRLFSTPLAAKYLNYGNTIRNVETNICNPEIKDCFDGKNLVNLRAEMNTFIKAESDDIILYFSQSHDGVEVTKNVTYTPIVASILNYPPETRTLLGTLLLLGFLPPSIKGSMYQRRLRPVVKMFAKRRPGNGKPLTVYNAHTKKNVNVYFVLAAVVNDIRALPVGTCGRHPPCYIGTYNI